MNRIERLSYLESKSPVADQLIWMRAMMEAKVRTLRLGFTRNYLRDLGHKIGKTSNVLECLQKTA